MARFLRTHIFDTGNSDETRAMSRSKVYQLNMDSVILSLLDRSVVTTCFGAEPYVVSSRAIHTVSYDVGISLEETRAMGLV